MCSFSLFYILRRLLGYPLVTTTISKPPTLGPTTDTPGIWDKYSGGSGDPPDQTAPT